MFAAIYIRQPCDPGSACLNKFLQVLCLPDFETHSDYEQKDKYIKDIFEDAGFDRDSINWQDVTPI